MLVSQLNFKTLKIEVFQKKDTIFLSRSGERFLPNLPLPLSARFLSSSLINIPKPPLSTTKQPFED